MPDASVQRAFTTPMERSHEVISRLARLYADADSVNLAVSGGTDSTVAADIFARLAPLYGIEVDSVTHINTGTAIPQSRLTARIIAAVHDLEWIEQGYRNPQDALAVRVLNEGWPAGYGGSPQTGGHGLEWANRKDKPMDEVYVAILDGLQIWVSGARKLESKKRQGNVPDSGIEQDKPYRVWCSPISGWTAEEKRQYIRDRGLPVSEAYVFLGFSGECTACSFDERALLNRIEILSPELAYALKSLAVWLYQRVRRGDVDLAPKRLCWGWQPDDDEVEDTDQKTLSEDEETAQAMMGCDEESCQTRESPAWVRSLSDEQIVDRSDVKTWWNDGLDAVTARFDHLGDAPNGPEVVALAG